LINGVLNLKICLTEEDFLDINKGLIVDPDDSFEWIKRNVVGNITKEFLTKTRS